MIKEVETKKENDFYYIYYNNGDVLMYHKDDYFKMFKNEFSELKKFKK